MLSASRTEPCWMHLTLLVLLFYVPVAFSSRSGSNSRQSDSEGDTMRRTTRALYSGDGTRAALAGRKELALHWAGRPEKADSGFIEESVPGSRSDPNSSNGMETEISASSMRGVSGERRRFRSWESVSATTESRRLRPNFSRMAHRKLLGRVMRPRTPVPPSAPIHQIHSVPGTR